jgi:thiamine-monophosphate kinase
MPSTPEGPDGPTLRDLGEDRLVAAVVSRFTAAPGWLRVPPGDDAAVLDLPPGAGLVTGTDTVVEGEDFRRDWSTGADVGVKVAAQNLADLAAMGARPLALLVSLAAPADLPAGWATDLADGLAAECTRAGAHVIGGDVSGAPLVVVTGTALGLLDGPAVLRSGARPGDVVALAGVTGPSAAGLDLLLAGWTDVETADVVRLLPGPQLRATAARLVAAHRRPRPPYPAGPRAAAAGATAMIDTSDGLLRDAGRVGRASGVLLDLDPAALDLTDDLVAIGLALGVDPLGWALTGGEDHGLLACFPPGTPLPEGFRAVGVVREPSGDGASGTGVVVAGRAWDGESGWLHFR